MTPTDHIVVRTPDGSSADIIAVTSRDRRQPNTSANAVMAYRRLFKWTGNSAHESRKDKEKDGIHRDRK